MPRARRAPDREAGREIVDAILRASALILERAGIEALTTNTVARIAGVSVGSLYRYFPDKRAIVAELARTMVGRVVEVVGQYVPPPGADSRTVAWELLRLGFHPALGGVPLRRILLREVPRSWINDTIDLIDRTLEQALTAYIWTHASELRPGPAQRMAYVVIQSVVGVLNGALLLEPSWMHDPGFQRELFLLMWRFVAPDGAELAPPDGPPISFEAREERWDSAVDARFAEQPPERRLLSIVPPPRSKRAEATRRALLDAAANVLAREGLTALTARRIASEANVTPGALYRHFRHMESLASALRLDYEVRVRRGVADAVHRMKSASTRDAITYLVEAYASHDTASLPLRQALLSEVPKRWAEQATLETQRMGRLAVAGELDRRGAEIRGGDREQMAFIACRAVEGVIEASIRRELGDDEREEVKALSIDLVCRYVCASPR